MGFSQSLCAFLAVIIGGTAFAQELPRGDIVEDVPCQQDASQRYALYLPSYFNLSRRWPVILAFDGDGGGREGVERYRAAAEKYGYVVAGSNNSRNGPWNVGLDAAAAMTEDIKRRFPIDLKRIMQEADSSERRIARRMLADLRASRRGVPNQKYQEWIQDIHPPAPPQSQ